MKQKLGVEWGMTPEGGIQSQGCVPGVTALHNSTPASTAPPEKSARTVLLFMHWLLSPAPQVASGDLGYAPVVTECQGPREAPAMQP